MTLANLGDAVMPVELELGFDDGTTELVKLPVEIWYGGDRYVYADHARQDDRERAGQPGRHLPRCGAGQRRLEAPHQHSHSIATDEHG